ncbi:MAG: hypothetical protein ABI335_06625 [Polyangiaceae bacterium]
MTDEYVVALQMATHPLTDDDIHELGRGTDAALQALALAVTTGPVVTALAALTWVENVSYSKGLIHYSEFVAPILDHIVPRVPAPAVDRPLDGKDVRAVQPLIYAASTYHALTDAIMNALKKRARAHRTVRGRVVVYPVGDADAEQRARWFELRWRTKREADGQAIVPAISATAVAAIDAHVQSHALEIEQRHCEVPVGNWYDQHCERIVDGALDGQFAHVHQTEVWARLSVGDIRRALRTIWMRAARRLLVHQRAMVWLRQHTGIRPDVLLTAIECVEPADIVADFERTGLDAAAATALLATMTRQNRGERYPIESYPLIALDDGRLAFAPSCILYGNWPMAQERAAARTDGGRIGNVRDDRNVARVVQALRDQFLGGHVETEVPLRDDSGRDITDLDVACVSADRRYVLVLQLKSFVTPLNLMDLDRADDDIEEGLEQCRRAANRVDRVQAELEARIQVKLDPAWSLRQCVVVEAYTGSAAPVVDLPVVSLEWLESEGVSALALGGVPEFHRRAQTLPDGRAFFDSCRPLHALVEDGENGLTTGNSWAVWSYASE